MAHLNETDKRQIRERLQDIQPDVPLTLVLTGHVEDSGFKAVSDAVSAAAETIRIETARQETGLPGFQLKENIRFSAFPMERELSPFLDALMLAADQKEAALDQDVRADLDAVRIPVHLKLYVALTCPHCPGMVSTVVPLAVQNQNIKLDIIDGSLFPDQASKDQVMAAPCLILDDQFRWTGMTPAKEISSMMADRDPSKLGAATLQMILEQGDAEWIADQMINSGRIFDAFAELLLHETWSVRLGAMVVVESLAEKSKKLAVQMCPMLIGRFNSADQTQKGDILYALGEAGDAETLEWIRKTLPSLDHPELQEAAEEAIESLTET